jgi:hypothetical protein
MAIVLVLGTSWLSASNRRQASANLTAVSRWRSSTFQGTGRVISACIALGSVVARIINDFGAITNGGPHPKGCLVPVEGSVV